LFFRLLARIFFEFKIDCFVIFGAIKLLVEYGFMVPVIILNYILFDKFLRIGEVERELDSTTK